MFIARQVQHTGVAPTDDSFTVIVPGKENSTKDGRTLVDDPDFGFGGLQRFGLPFLSHLSMKVRDDIRTKDVILVDSPGMIDNPAIDSSKHSSRCVLVPSVTSRDRGYDFMGVTRWFAEKADVILFFFDPDKPGTTGETLQALTQALQGPGLEAAHHPEQGGPVLEGARLRSCVRCACMEPGEGDPRKDMPEINTMCVPHDEEMKEPESKCIPLADLQHIRQQVLDMVLRAPASRLDNMISRLSDSAQTLLLHARVVGR